MRQPLHRQDVQLDGGRISIVQMYDFLEIVLIPDGAPEISDGLTFRPKPENVEALVHQLRGYWDAYGPAIEDAIWADENRWRHLMAL